MALTIEKQEDDQRQLEMKIEIPEDRIDQGMRKLVKKLAKDYRIPGFRAGKAPANIIIKRFGAESLRAQVIEEMLNDVLVEALEQEDVNPFAAPTLNKMDLNPPTVELTVPLEPVVQLGDYREIRREIDQADVADEAVDEALEQFRMQHAVVEAVDRPSQEGDIVKVVGKGAFVDGEGEDAEANLIFDNQEGLEFTLDREKTFAGSNFVDEMVGLSVGDEKTFTVSFDEEHDIEEFAGREAQFEITVLEVSSRTLPELDDALVKEAGEHETVDELRASERERLEKAAESKAKSDFLDGMVEAMQEGAELVYPPAAIEQELDSMVENMKQQVSGYGWEWEDYLSMQAETEDTLKEQWLDNARKSVEQALVIRQFIENERLGIEQNEIETALEERMGQFDDMDDEMKQMMRRIMVEQGGMQRMANDLMMDKVYDRMSAIAVGDAPDLDALDAEKAAADAEETEADEADVDDADDGTDEEE